MPTQDLFANLLLQSHGKFKPATSFEPPQPHAARLSGVVALGAATGLITLVGNEPHDTTPDWLLVRPEGLANYVTLSNTMWGSKYEIDLANTSTVLDGSVIVGADKQLVFRHRNVSPAEEPVAMLTYPGSSVLRVAPMSYLKRRATSLLALAAQEDFEFGVDSAMSQAVMSLVKEHGSRAIHAVREVLKAKPSDTSVTAELLSDVGRIQHVASRDVRREFLVEYLRSPHIPERHSAASGLAELQDPRALKDLDDAYQVEQSQRLRRHIARVIAYLRTLR